MNVLIKGMKMPKGCYECPLMDFEYGECGAGATGEYDPYRKDCPLEEPKTGHWILSQDDVYEYCTCSNCGYMNGENWMNGSNIPFCANCGADMRGEEE